jgi:predicted nucleic acid-binding protein
MNVLVDTSIWSLALRRSPEQLNPSESMSAAELTELIKEGRAKILGPIRQELLTGIRIPAQYEKLRALLEAFPDELIDTADYEKAASFANICRAKGMGVSPVDMLICAVAANHDCSIFTNDADFARYALAFPIRLYAPRARSSEEVDSGAKSKREQAPD